MKVTVIGGGSTYTPELVNGFLARVNTFPLRELCLMDIQKTRLDIVAGFAQRMVSAQGSPFEVTLTTDQREAIRGASYVITQLRVGLMEARRADEYLGQRHGLVGQETTGIGGMAKALRTIPVMMSIADDIRSVAPGALLANFTNPAGLITEALARYAPDIQAVGVCNVPITAKMMMLERLETLWGTRINPERARLDTLGLNHLTWHRGFTIDGENVWDQVLEGFLDELRACEQPEWDIKTIESLQMIPNYYLQYYYYTDHKLAQQSNWPPSRADEVIEIEKDLLLEYGDPGRSTLPDDLMQRGGAYYSTLATQLINAHFNDLGETHILNIRHAGAVADWPDNWVLEMPCRVDRNGVHPEFSEPLPPVCFGLIAQVKSYEELTARAAVHGDRQAAYQALLSHPLGPTADRVPAVLEEMLAINAAYLPQFDNA
jgi:6-phospho-beta-glucosidase